MTVTGEHQTTTQITAGRTSNAEGSGARFTLPTRGRLIMVTLFTASGSGPCQADITIQNGDARTSLKSGWVRAGPVDWNEAHGLRWKGEIDLSPDRAYIFFGLDNRTGATVTWQGNWVVTT